MNETVDSSVHGHPGKGGYLGGGSPKAGASQQVRRPSRVPGAAIGKKGRGRIKGAGWPKATRSGREHCY
ncbi:MAG: hypothetical protein ACREML_04270 [Vulcanimicrobiaceae bacterium]